MTNRRTKRNDTDRNLDRADLAAPVDPEELFAHWLPTYAPGLSVDENASGLAKALWGRSRADWAWCLAKEVVARFPEAIQSDQSPGWVASLQALFWLANIPFAHSA